MSCQSRSVLLIVRFGVLLYVVPADPSLTLCKKSSGPVGLLPTPTGEVGPRSVTCQCDQIVLIDGDANPCHLARDDRGRRTRYSE